MKTWTIRIGQLVATEVTTAELDVLVRKYGALDQLSPSELRSIAQDPRNAPPQSWYKEPSLCGGNG